jgi:rhodanese-related sulfurtransferase
LFPLNRFLLNIIQFTCVTIIVSLKLRIFTKNKTMNLTQEEWVSQFETDTNAVVLDVRTEDEYNDGMIANAINLDIHKGQGFIDGLEALDKSKNYYVYCRSGARSAKACEVMEDLGFENAYNLLGGILEWDGEIV